jgi:hypothetical protein
MTNPLSHPPSLPPCSRCVAGPEADTGESLLTALYHSILNDAGSRSFLGSIKALGDDLAAAMTDAWGPNVPPLHRLVAYTTALAGVLFLLRSKLPGGAPVQQVGIPG